MVVTDVGKLAHWYRDTLRWKVRVESDRVLLDDLEVVMLRTSPMLGTMIWHRQSTLRALICRPSSTAPVYWLFPDRYEDGYKLDHPHLSMTGAGWTVGLPWELPTTTGSLLAPSRWWPQLPGTAWRMPTRTGLGQVAETVAGHYLEEARQR
jgi:hypothetical protein